MVLKRPAVSILVAFLNAQAFLPDAVNSVFGQTVQDWELILVDDGSTDESTGVARQYAQDYPDKVKYMEHPGHQNLGLAASRDLALRVATGDHVAILDSDDVWFPQKLERQLLIMRQHPTVGMVSGCSEYWTSWDGNAARNQQDRIIGARVELNCIHLPPSLLPAILSGAAMPPCPSDVLFRRDALLGIGGFEIEFSGWRSMYEDQAFLAKTYLHLPVFVSGECWDRYRVHGKSICAVTTAAGMELDARLFYLRWLERYLVQNSVTDAKTWRELKRKRWRCEHPRLDGATRLLARIGTRIRQTVVLARR